MSRGLGKLQRALWAAIQQHGKPMTFDDIRAVALGNDPDRKLRPAFERSLRRALQYMVRDGGLIAIGEGGRSEPFRYFIHPLVLGGMGDDPETRAWMQALLADPGADEAANKALAKMLATTSHKGSEP